MEDYNNAMNFKALKEILAKICASLPCRNCGTPFKDHQIQIIGAFLSEGYFIAFCQTCQHRTIISVGLNVFARVHQGLKRNHENRPFEINTAWPSISTNDILDMRNFLKAFDGDFINLFKESV